MTATFCHHSHYRTAIGTVIAGLLLLPFSTTVHADGKHAMNEKWYLSAGGYSVFRADTTLSLVERNVGAGAAIRPGDTLGLDLEETVLRLEGHYRFTPRSQIVASWVQVESDASKVLQKEIDWVDQGGNTTTVAAGSTVSSSLGYEIMKASYFYSFYHNDKVELMAGGGLHVSRFDIDLDVKTDPGGTVSAQETRDAAHTVPLPTVGFGLNYRVNPKLYWFLKAEGFYLEYDDWKGLFSEMQVGMEYNVWRNLGVGVGLATSNLNVTETAPQYTFRYDNRLSGANLFLSWSL